MCEVAAKTKEPTATQSSHGSSKMLASAQPQLKSHNVEKTKNKLHSSGRGSHRPKTHDGLREARREHQTSHHAHVSKAGISTDGLRAGPKEIPHEVVREPPSAGHAGLHSQREVVRRHSRSAGGQRPNPKHLEESRSKPVPSHNAMPVPHRMTSDQQLLASHGGTDTKSGSGVKGEAKMSAKVRLSAESLVYSAIILLQLMLKCYDAVDLMTGRSSIF